MLSQQLECGDLVTRIRNSRGRTRGKTGQRKNKKQLFLQSVNDIETSPSVQDTNAGTHDISKLATEVQLFSQSRFYNVAIRSLVQSGELPESWLESLDNINMEDYKMTSLSALGKYKLLYKFYI